MADVNFQMVLNKVLKSKTIKDKKLTKIIGGCAEFKEFLSMTNRDNVFGKLLTDGKFESSRFLGTLLSNNGFKVDWKRWMDADVHEKLGLGGYSEKDILLYCAEEYRNFDIIETKDYCTITSMLAREPCPNASEYEMAGRLLNTFPENKIIRTQILLCLLACKYEKTSAFSKLPYALVRWMMEIFYGKMNEIRGLYSISIPSFILGVTKPSFVSWFSKPFLQLLLPNPYG